MSEFGKVLESAGWARCNKSGVVRLDRYWCNDEGFNGKIMWSVYPGTYNRSQYNLFLHWLNGDQLVDITVKDEHQVLRIVAAIEGTDRWRTDKPLEGVKYELKTVPHDLRPNKVDILLNCTFDSGLWMDGNGARLGATRVLAWRPCLDAYWEVAK